ncbi:hypothetical protein PoB_003785400, partial [Plakobranchus ocellatus]
GLEGLRGPKGSKGDPGNGYHTDEDFPTGFIQGPPGTPGEPGKPGKRVRAASLETKNGHPTELKRLGVAWF